MRFIPILMATLLTGNFVYGISEPPISSLPGYEGIRIHLDGVSSATETGKDYLRGKALQNQCWGQTFQKSTDLRKISVSANVERSLRALKKLGFGYRFNYDISEVGYYYNIKVSLEVFKGDYSWKNFELASTGMMQAGHIRDCGALSDIDRILKGKLSWRNFLYETRRLSEETEETQESLDVIQQSVNFDDLGYTQATEAEL